MLNDSGMEIDEEFLESFLLESAEVLTNLKSFVIDFKSPEDNHLFEKFGQQIDRIMGAAYTLSLNEVGDLARQGKELGYKSSQIDEVAKLLSIQSILSQLVKTLESAMKSLKKGNRPDTDEIQALLKKLTTANNQLGNLRTTVKL